MIETPMYPAIGSARVENVSGSFGISLAVGLSVIGIAALWLSGQSQFLRIAIPGAAMLCGLALYLSRPIPYVQYSLWVWFLTPLVRRIVDWQFGFAEPNFVLLAPFLVSGISILTLIVPSRRGDGHIPMPFALCGSAILYGFIVGMVLHPSGETIFGLVNWLCPLLFGLHVYLNWRHYDQYLTAISNTFVLAVVVLGTYGVYQFFSPPGWDLYWLENVSIDAINPSFGQPAPFLVRVWSTANAPGTFATIMMVGLLLLVTIRSSVKFPAAMPGYISFLMSGVRTAWLSFLVGLFLMFKNTNPREIFKIFMVIVLLLSCVFLLALDPRLATMITERMSTFTDLGHDASFTARLEMYRILAMDVIDHPFGYGLSNMITTREMVVDSGILAMLFALGWPGSLAFAAGLLAMFLANKDAPIESGKSSQIAQATTIAILSQVIGGNIFMGVSGAMFWIFAATFMSINRYEKFSHFRHAHALET